MYLFSFPARKLRNCFVGAVLGLDREIPDLSTLSVLCKGKLANLSSFLSIYFQASLMY